jgi:7-keto-8-aminopelargonate synthetase-like enzyme
VAGALAALELLREQPRRVEKLQANAETLRSDLAREGFEVTGAQTQIVPLVVGDAHLAMSVCEAALERGVFAQAIRPPTVPEGTSRLRLAVMASHTRGELREAAQTLSRAAMAAGFQPGAAEPIVTANDAARARAAGAPVRDALAEAA